jgi:hypothetical protein
MSKPFPVVIKSAFVILFVCSAMPAFAQRGGGGGGIHGGGGGGFHGVGGGGFHGGGAASPRGGGGPHVSGGSGFRGGSYSPPAAGFGGSNGPAPSPQRSGGQFLARPGNSFARPGGTFSGGGQRVGNSPPAVADGHWHSFGGPGGGRGPSGAQSEARASNNGEGFHTFSGNREPGSTGSVRSFSGEGREVWENTPVARNVVPKSQSLSTLHSSFGRSVAGSSGLRSNSTPSASSRFAGGSSSVRIRSGQETPASVGRLPIGSSIQIGNQFNHFNRFNRFGRGCWNCGFGFGEWGNGWGWGWGWGFGGGWGFGWPWAGFWGWDPFWVDPGWGWSAPVYNYYSYPNNYIYNSPDTGSSYQNDNSNPPPQEDNQASPDGNWVTPNGPSPSLSPNSSNLTVPVLIYLKSGAVYTVRDYWMIVGELHYILMSGAQNSVELEQVDLPRTNAENAKSGVKFIFKSEPSITAQPDAQPGSPNEPAPTQQINAVPQPEART